MADILINNIDSSFTGWWNLDQASSYDDGGDTKQTDHGFGGSNPATVTGTTFVAGPKGETNGAMHFNGTSDLCRIGNYDPTDSGQTLSAFSWVNIDSLQAKHLFDHYDLGNNQRSWSIASYYYFGLLYGYFLFSDDGTTNAGHFSVYQASSGFNPGTWTLIGFTFDNGTIKLYKNGIYDNSPNIVLDGGITTLHASTADLTIGSSLDNDAAAELSSAAMAKCYLRNTVMTDTEIMALYNRTKPIVTATAQSRIMASMIGNSQTVIAAQAADRIRASLKGNTYAEITGRSYLTVDGETVNSGMITKY